MSMIHIATVHYNTDKWINIQYSYLQKNIESEFRVYSFLVNISEHWSEKHYFSLHEPIEDHSAKLNILSNHILENLSGQDDFIMFLDGDAFPIVPIDEYIRQNLKKYSLLAIQRLENLGDIQPHPSFCVTKADFWKRIEGEWSCGYRWVNAVGSKITDVGGNLLKTLIEKNINWLPMQRTNKINLHPLWFGIYDNIIYHHGSGFREGISRIEKYKYEIRSNYIRRKDSFFSPSSSYKQLINKLCFPESRKRRILLKMNEPIQKAVFQRIKEDPDFYKFFMVEGP